MQNEKFKNAIQNSKVNFFFRANPRKLLLVLIFLTGIFLRLVYLREWFHFEMDEATIAWKLKRLIVDGEPFLIGGGTPFGFHLGPAFYYLSAIPLWLTGLDPIGWGVLAALVGGITIWLAEKTGKRMYGPRVGILFSLLWATSFVAVTNDRHWWPLVLDPLLALSVMFLLFQILENKSEKIKWWLMLGLVLAFAWQADLSVLVLFLAAGAAAVKKIKTDWRGIGAAMLVGLVSLLPLLVFEIRHPGSNLGRISGIGGIGEMAGAGEIGKIGMFFTKGLSRLAAPVASIDGDLSKIYSWCRPLAGARVMDQPMWLAVLSGLILLRPLWRRLKKRNTADGILSLMIIAGLSGIMVFGLLGGNLYDFYLAPIYPVFLLLLAVMIDYIFRQGVLLKLVGVTGLILIVGVNLFIIGKSHHPQGLAAKQEAVVWASEKVDDATFALESLSQCDRYNGVRYLFMLEGNEPALSFMDPAFFWLYDSLPEVTYPDLLAVTVIPNDLTANQKERYNLLKESEIESKKFDALEVLIVNNEEKQFKIEF